MAAYPSQRSQGEQTLQLERDLKTAGFYPQLAMAVFSESLYQETLLSHLVHVDTHFDMDSIHRHISALLLTPIRLILGHIDDDPRGPEGGTAARVSTEDIPLTRLRTVLIARTYENPERFRPGQLPADVVITLAWDSLRRLDLVPEACGDPQCDADHGYSGTSTAEDLSIRVSAMAEGQEALEQALRFAGRLRESVHQARTAAGLQAG
ncbi:DUF5998 family protein [Sediminivirga luteola]|uniref:DUF5998 family protein n=1 Tax=Sediminivirga luteola TaxID=1774748 RepID=UPI001F5A6C6F|nr:DUF5998 family protein [Sediminivirga luteola]MCI2265575.1 DUF5998 family protein [Sediminivirga luteola]